MPLYNYRCEKCNTIVEVFQKHTDPAPKCECDGNIMVREFNTPAFKFENGQGTGMGRLMSIAGHTISSTD